MSVKAYWVINVNRPKQLRRQLSRSFVRRFLELLLGLGAYPVSMGTGAFMYSSAPVQTLDTSNTLRTLLTFFGALAPQGSVDGIQIGNGTAPVTWNDYKLASPIPHSPSGVVYGAMSYSNIVDEPAGGSFRLIRAFTNNGATAITITEVGLAARAVASGVGFVQILLARDLLSTPVIIAPGATATIRYIIRVTM
jgi:hypothetical protein